MYYGERCVLDGVSLDVQSGEVLALIGPNGVGKSTLIRAVSGVIPMRSGHVRTNGDDFMTLSPMQRARYVAVVPQAIALPPAFTVWEMVLLGRTPYLNFLGQVSSADEARARYALERVAALDLIERRIGELSGGEQQRVLLARALAQETPILLLDEPTAHLDWHHQSALLDLVRKESIEKNLAVLVALHDLNLAALFSDRIALLHDGHLRALGTPSQVLTAEQLSDIYRLPVCVIDHPEYGVPLVLPERKLEA